MAEALVKLALATVVALLVGWLDQYAGFDLAWWVCALIGLVVVFGGWLVLVVADE